MRTTVRSAGWQIQQTLEELVTTGLLWEHCPVDTDISSSLWCEVLLKNVRSWCVILMKLDKHTLLIFLFLSHHNLHLSAVNYWHYLCCFNKRLVGDCKKKVMGSKRPPCSINYASAACLITWSTTLENKPWPDLLIIKMQSNLLPVCCSDWTWRGAFSQHRCSLVTLKDASSLPSLTRIRSDFIGLDWLDWITFYSQSRISLKEKECRKITLFFD